MPKEKSTKRNSVSRTGKFCVAAGCTSTHQDNLSLHEFPKDDRPDIRRQWINFVKVKRKDFTHPTRYSVLCEKHFPPGSYPIEYELKKSMNIKVKKKVLLSHAVPTIQTVPEIQSQQPAANDSDTSLVITRPLMSSTPVCPQKERKAYRKRECARVSYIYPKLQMRAKYQ